MNCPTCKDKKGRALRVDPVSKKCQKCGVRMAVDHTGKHRASGGKKPAVAAPART